MEILIQYQNGQDMKFYMNSESDTLLQLKEWISIQTGIPMEYQKLIHNGHILSDNSVALNALKSKSSSDTNRNSNKIKILLVASSLNEVEWIQAQKEDKLIKPFSAAASKYSAKPKISSNRIQTSSQFGFGSIQELKGFADSDKARNLLQSLTEDKGIRTIMETHSWNVGILKEMPPDGKVGVDPVCVLGFNVGKGMEINLRLRTDDLKGFRPWNKLIEVLCHELAHNVHSEHDSEFYALMNQLLKEYKNTDWKSSAGNITGSEYASHYAEPTSAIGYDVVVENERWNFDGGVQRLGGGEIEEENDVKMKQDPRVAAALAAEKRSVSRNATRLGNKKASLLTNQVQNDQGQEREQKEHAKSSAKSDSSEQNSMEHSALSVLESMGFSETRSKDALQQSHGDLDGAITYLLATVHSDPPQESIPIENEDMKSNESLESLMIDDNDTAIHTIASGTIDFESEITHTLNSIDQELKDNTNSIMKTDYVTVLRTLLKYVTNILEDPLRVEFHRISMVNAAFSKRVGRVKAAVKVLNSVGFIEQQQQSVLYLKGNPDLVRLYITKDVIERILLDLNAA